jgi:hypothetical protein
VGDLDHPLRGFVAEHAHGEDLPGESLGDVRGHLRGDLSW